MLLDNKSSLLTFGEEDEKNRTSCGRGVVEERRNSTRMHKGKGKVYQIHELSNSPKEHCLSHSPFRSRSAPT